ncbi:MAG: T9SS type A sorting domain-containing protein [candidate division WOR-3 bacterium]
MRGIFFYFYLFTSIFVWGQNWTREVVDSSIGEGFIRTSLKLDSRGFPHILYDGSSYYHPRVHYAHWNGNFWELEKIDTTLCSLFIFSGNICLDNSDRPHIFYYCCPYPTNRFWIKYGRKEGDLWQTEEVDSGDTGGRAPHCEKFSELALSRDGNPHLCYSWLNLSDSIGEIRYAYKRGNDWLIKTIWQDTGSFFQPWLYSLSFALDTLDRPAVLFTTRPFPDTSYLFLLRFTGSGWKLDTIAKNYPGFLVYAVRVSENNQIHILFESFFSIYHAFEINGGWEIERVEGIQEWPCWMDMVLSVEEPHIVYSSTMEFLTYAYKSGGLWHFEIVDSCHPFCPSLDRDREGRVYVSYVASDSGSLYFARRDFSPIEEVRRKGLRDVKIYPNPVSSPLHLSFPQFVSEIKIFDIAGKRVKEEKLSNGKIFLKDIKPGVYILKVKSKREKFTQKLIIK